VDEICHALAVQIGSNDLDCDNMPRISTILDCCQGLVTIEKGTSAVRLIHYTLQEYLRTHPDLFHRAHSTMAETCLTYLNFQHVKDLAAHLYPNPRSTPFLKYSSLYWGTHIRLELSDGARTFALELLDQFDSHISAKSLWTSILEGLPFYYYLDDKPFSALHCIAYFGIADLTNALIKMNRWDVNQRDGVGMTPLIWAARYRHEEVARLLLGEKHIEPDQQDTNCGQTALSWAAENGCEGIVRQLLEREDIDPNTQDPIDGRTPLSAKNGHERVVKLLLEEKDINPNTSKYHCPLSWAVKNGHEGVVKLLLGRKDVGPNTPDPTFGRTPLGWASKHGHEGTVKLLLGREDVDPDIRDL